ncbi:capsular biosynthesis protein [Oligella urethralis]|uniref:capsule biosynthesis protein n=1 Tax=Oligella urethralis TaxID=90245 RepID=UPI000CFE6784|nr:capsular biosynthesis protein [Oligella urethralis]AVL71593.1 capsular biosynthesis protein [Oligella urethralis]
MLKKSLHQFDKKNILLLQGPVGPFFRRFASDLKRHGAIVHSISFNGGDWFFNRGQSINFRKHPREWRHFLKEFLERHAIDYIFLFGDCRPYHMIARQIASELKICVSVFEEGYIRPNFITLEEEGVNNFSQCSRQAQFYFDHVEVAEQPERQLGYTFAHMASYAVIYYLFGSLLKPFFWHYQHHRPLSLIESFAWIRSACRKWVYRYTERHMQTFLTEQLAKQYFLFPLQVYNDSQIHTHSDFAAVKHTIKHVVASFAKFAPPDAHLVIKHHPMDRGYNDYKAWIEQLTFLHNLYGRLHCIHDQHLPSLLNNALGTIVVNSTVGLSALLHGSPLKVIGRAMYDFKQLTYQGELDEFWREAREIEVDEKLFKAFRNYLIANTQLNGSFYKRLRGEDTATGVVWAQMVDFSEQEEGAGASASAKS